MSNKAFSLQGFLTYLLLLTYIQVGVRILACVGHVCALRVCVKRMYACKRVQNNTRYSGTKCSTTIYGVVVLKYPSM